MPGHHAAYSCPLLPLRCPGHDPGQTDRHDHTKKTSVGNGYTAHPKPCASFSYILGLAYFLGRAFQVSPDVLIPRPETEALVQQIIQENPQAGLRILDLGTGSGCIAITLQQELAQATVHAVDIDKAALRMTQTNAQKFGATLHLIQADIFHDPLPAQHWGPHRQ